jgi:hypothetical protein
MRQDLVRDINTDLANTIGNYENLWERARIEILYGYSEILNDHVPEE